MVYPMVVTRKQVLVQLDDEQVERLDRLAEREGTSRSELLRRGAAAVLAAAHAGLSVHEYSPASVKQAVTGYGRGGKDQVGEMIKLQFGLRTVPEPADAADALALAITHLWRGSASNRLEAAVARARTQQPQQQTPVRTR